MVKFPAVFKNQKFITLLTRAPPVVPIPYQINSVATHSPRFLQINSSYDLGDLAFESRQGQKIYLLFNKASRPILGPIQPPIQWVRGSFRGETT